MAEEIISVFWTDNAKSSFDHIIKYLEQEWSDKEVEKLIKRTIDDRHAATVSGDVSALNKEKKCQNRNFKQAYTTDLSLSAKEEAN